MKSVPRLISMFLCLTASLASSQGTLIIDDPLTSGTTVGVRDNGPGQFVSGGWMVTGSSDNIRYTTPIPIEAGAIELDITGLRFDDTRPQNHRGQIMSMYDASFGDPRHVYAPDIRTNPFKFVLFRNGRDEEAYFANYMKLVMNTDGVNQFEDYSAAGAFRWEEIKTYRMRLEWGNGIIRFTIDGRDVDRWPFVYRSTYRPAIHDIRIATNTRNNAIHGAVYSNVKIYDFGAPPAAPVLNHPRAVVNTLAPIVDWSGEPQTKYEARVTRSADPEADVVWSSGAVTSGDRFARSGSLSDGMAYFAHVRLRNVRGWGAWSAPRAFETRAREPLRVPVYTEHEIQLLSSNRRDNPYRDIRVRATFDGPTQSITTDGFWDGGSMYKVRVLPAQAGTWSWRVSSNDASLDGESGSFVAEGSSNRGYVRVSPERPYSFEWAGTREPFFFMGDTIWHMFYNLSYLDGSFQSLIDDRAAQHFNYAHGVVHDFLNSEGGPIYRRQDPEREMFDTDWLNPSYFNIIDHKIDYMNARGMAAGLFFSWGNEGYQEYEDPEQYERYMRYLVARYATKNVFWIVVGEFEEAGEPRTRWRDYQRVVADADPYGHPITLHTVRTTDAFGPDPEHSFVSHQRKGTPEELRELIESSRIYDKPVINLEYGYEGDPRVFSANQSADEVRADHYALSLAGGYGVYGNHVPWYSTYHRVADFVLEATDTPGAEYLEILYEFFEATQFHRLEPSQQLVDRGIAAAWAGHEYVVQLPAGGPLALDLNATANAFDAAWFDPRTGGLLPIGTVFGGARVSFDAPTSGDDWILHLIADTSGGVGPVRIDLGASSSEQGIRLLAPPDGTTVPSTRMNRDARANADPGSDFYFYFDVNDVFHFEGGHADTSITVHYLDAGSGALTLQYDGADGHVYKDGGSVALTDSGQWRTHTFGLTDAWFGNRQNGGADFRIFGGVGRSFVIDIVEATHDAVTPVPPGPASSPSPASGSSDVSLQPTLSWRPGSGATAYDVYFGAGSTPSFVERRTDSRFVPGVLASGTSYVWRIDAVNDIGVTRGTQWSFTTRALSTASTLEMLPARGLQIDGRPEDWNLAGFGRLVRAGESTTGDIALVGYDNGGLYASGFATPLVLPTDARDHTARIYSRHDAQSLYFLARVDDDDLRGSHGVSLNWANDCVEIYIDPAGDGGSTPMHGSASEIQLVVDVNNQVNVYVVEPGYRDRVLGAVTSAVTRDANGWWLELRLLKDALAPAIPLKGELGLDFNFRDNDGNNDPERSTVYTWSDFERSASFPSKVPDRWGRARLLELGTSTLRVHPAGNLAIDGDPGDWNLSGDEALVRAGESVEGDVALVGYDVGALYWAGRFTGAALPTSAADHTVRVHARHDDSFLYFLFDLSDEDIQTSFGPELNWANDSLEIYLDPGADGGGAPLADSTSDVQLVIDAANQVNVYVASPGYGSQVLAGVVSAVSHHASGWWAEVRIQKSALAPTLSGRASFGLDFNFRDNDAGNDPSASSILTWSDTEQSARFPSKIPDRWGRARLVNIP